MLTTREGGAAASAPKRTEDDSEASDVGVNDLGDGGEVMCALRYHTRSVEETVWQRLSIRHTFYVVNVCASWPNANSFQEDVVCDCSLIQHVFFLESVWVV